MKILMKIQMKNKFILKVNIISTYYRYVKIT